ncbi:MED14-domain-containing protein [Aureobasidium sp. EXF-3400]|nr:MED14-domain-containing protein [Aureobasidium sp. EXF-12344]KAI4784771.1 MED14-domain-containing protein [Aureobasidium sp. EXF-3400]
MPGRIVMDSHAAPKTNGLKPDSPNMTSTATAHPNTLANGYSNGTTNEEEKALPPELEHWAHTYVPMGTLLERMAQQCYFDLGEVIEQMADLNIGTPQTNGASTAASDVSKPSVDKKLRLMNFANTQQARFIKALVLSDWARNMGDMDKLIELRMWLTQQDEASTQVGDAIMQMKHNMIGAKMPNPNIQGALELLSTSKAPWLPDLGYIAPKPLSAQKLLKTLRDMNFVLSVRLNLHEQLPPYFCNYSIANGRATFVVPNEFELDLAVTEEDTTSPFYFIDIRFLFSDAPPLADGPARAHLEGKVNQLLQMEGLSAAYDFLHGFASDLARTRWTECLHVEPVHRSLIVQYWTGQPGGKSWIEVGVKKGQKAEVSDQPHTLARLNVRWFRAGKEISDTSFAIDTANPSMEHLLNQVTAAHMTLRLEMIKNQLLTISPKNSVLDIDLKTSRTDPNACALSMKLAKHSLETTLRIIPVNGNISISPVSAASIDVERRLNSDPTIDAAQILSYLSCKLVQDQITRKAVQAGWLLMPTAQQGDINKIFSEQVIRRTTFTRHGWGEDWAICLTISLQGVKWWIVRLASTTPSSRTINTAETLSIPLSTKSFDRHTLMLIESRAVAQISLSNISSQLRSGKISHEIRHVSPTAANTTSPFSASMTTAVVGIKFEDCMQPSSVSERKTWKPWCGSAMILTHHGVDERAKDAVKVVHVVKANLTPQTARTLAPLVGTRTSTQDIVFGPNGILALQLRTHFGVGLIAIVKSKLRRVERLAICLAAIAKREFTVEKVAITGLVFRYSTASSPQNLKAGILFSDDTAKPMQLRFATEDALNPHRRVQPLLQNLLLAPPGVSSMMEEKSQVERLFDTLHTTTPLLSACAAIEAKDPAAKSSRVTIRNLAHLRIVYSSPLPSLALDIEAIRKEGKNHWSITVLKDFTPEYEKTLDLLQQVWQGKDIDGVKGFRTGIVAEVQVMDKLLLDFDALVRAQGGGGGQGHDIVVLD